MRFHEIVAAVFCIVGIVLLERMPVTYPRSALLFTYASPIAVIYAASIVIAAIRRRNRALVIQDAKEIARACVTLAVVFAVSFVLKSFTYLINPRVYDRQLFALDRRLHFGYSPTIFFGALFNQRPFLQFMDVFYTVIYYALFIFGTATIFALLDCCYSFCYGASFVLMCLTLTILYLVFPSWGPSFCASSLVVPSLRRFSRT